MKKIFTLILLFTLLLFSGCYSFEGYDVDVTIDELNSLTMQDSTVNILISKRIYKYIECTITNTTGEPIFIDYDYCTFVNHKGYTYQILSGFTIIGKIEDAQRIITLPSNSKYFSTMLPKELTYYSREEKDYVTEPIFEKVKKGDKCFLNLAYRLGEKNATVKYLKIPLKIVRAKKHIIREEE